MSTLRQPASIVLLPFNAAAERKRPHRACSTYGVTSDELWDHVLGLMRDEQREYNRLINPFTSLYHHLRDRISLRDWSTTRIKAERNRFLAEETYESYWSEGAGTVIRRNYLGFDTARRYVIGESRFWHSEYESDTAHGFDLLRRSERGKGLGLAFFLAKCHKAKTLGYRFYEVGVCKENLSSLRRIEHLVKDGKAIEIPHPHRGALAFRIDLKKI